MNIEKEIESLKLSIRMCKRYNLYGQLTQSIAELSEKLNELESRLSKNNWISEGF